MNEVNAVGDTVKALVECEMKGDRACVSRLFDIGAKAALLFGDIYTNGQPKDQARTREILLDRFMELTPVARKKLLLGKAGRLLLEKREDHWRVEEGVKGSDFKYRYRVEARDGGWVVTDRQYHRIGDEPAGSLLPKRYVRDLRQSLGREPTLGELNVGYKEYMERRRVRSYRIKGTGKGAK